MATQGRLNGRYSKAIAASLTTSAATTPEINKSLFGAGLVHVPTGSSITTLTFHAASAENGTYRALYTAAGAAVTLTVAAARAYVLPASVDVAPWIRVVADAAGDVTFTFQS